MSSAQLVALHLRNLFEQFAMVVLCLAMALNGRVKGERRIQLATAPCLSKGRFQHFQRSFLHRIVEKTTREGSKRAANLSDSTRVLGRPREFGYGERSLNIGLWRDTYLFSPFGGGLFFLNAGLLSFAFTGEFSVEIDNSLRTFAHSYCRCGGGMACGARCHPARGEAAKCAGSVSTTVVLCCSGHFAD